MLLGKTEPIEVHEQLDNQPIQNLNFSFFKNRFEQENLMAESRMQFRGTELGKIDSNRTFNPNLEQSELYDKVPDLNQEMDEDEEMEKLIDQRNKKYSRTRHQHRQQPSGAYPIHINLSLVNDFNENSLKEYTIPIQQTSQSEISITHILNSANQSSLITPDVTPQALVRFDMKYSQVQRKEFERKRKNVQSYVSLQNAPVTPFRKASKYETLLLQKHRMDALQKLKLDLIQCRSKLEELKWDFEMELNEQVAIHKNLYKISMPSPFTPCTPIQSEIKILRRQSDINYQNYKSQPQKDYYADLLRRIPKMREESVFLNQQLQIQHNKLEDIWKAEQNAVKLEAQLVSIVEAKNIVSEATTLFRKQINDIMEKKNYLQLQTMQINNEIQIEKMLIEWQGQYTQECQISKEYLQTIVEHLGYFLITLQSKGRNQFQSIDLQSPQISNKNQLWVSNELERSTSNTSQQSLLRSPLLQQKSPLRSPNSSMKSFFIQSLKEMENESRYMIQRFQKKTQLMEQNYKEQKFYIEKSKQQLIDDITDSRKLLYMNNQNQDEHFQLKQQQIKEMKQKIKEQYKQEEMLKVENDIAFEKIVWLRSFPQQKGDKRKQK